MIKTRFLAILVFIAASLSSYGQNVPRPEHPTPQFVRADWINLNGEWTCEIDNSKVGDGRKYHEKKGFSKPITVPYCVESELSGVGFKDFISQMWYHRKVTVPASWKGKKAILHFGAVDFEAEIFINGKSLMTHFGGTAPFAVDLSHNVKAGETFDLVVKVNDDARSRTQMCGKQSLRPDSYGCLYTRVTGIWQTVWMEAVNKTSLHDMFVVPDVDNKLVIFTPRFNSMYGIYNLKIEIKDGKKVVSKKSVKAVNGIPVQLKIRNPKLWSPQSPFLYDIVYTLTDASGNIVDKVNSYFGMRKFHYEGNRFYLNNKPVYLRLVLDQGFYPKGIWTAPTDADLKKDIELSMNLGFNGARLHQKVFEPRFHYWADKLGYLTWGEASDWGMDWGNPMAAYNFQGDWKTLIKRDRNHPSIIAWTPFNESWKYSNNENYKRFYNDIYEITTSLDPTRLVNMASGGTFVGWTDIWTAHTYTASGKDMAKKVSLNEKGEPRHRPASKYPFEGQPYVLDEYGGVKWTGNSSNGWGYGNAPKSLEEFYKRIEDLTNALLKSENVAGYTYTQLTDVEQEQNGLYNYDRSIKLDVERLRKIFSKNPEWLKKK